MQTVAENSILDTVSEAFLRLDRAGRRRAKQTLRQSEKLLRVTLDCANVGVWTENRVTGEFTASPVAKRLHGLPEQTEMNYEVASAAVHPEDRQRVEASKHAMKDGRPLVVEYRTLWPDGTVRWLLAQARFIGHKGKRTRLVGVVQNITDRKLMENALRKSEEKFAKAFQSSPAAIAIVDLASRSYVDVNEAFEALTGHRRLDVVGHAWDEVTLWADPHGRDEALGQLAKEGRLRNCEFRFQGKNGGIASACFPPI